MDYRHRKYFAARLYHYNDDLKELQEAVPSLEIHKPYNHFARFNYKDCVYDGDILRNYVHVLLTCRKEDVDKLKNKIDEMKHRSFYGNYIFIKEYKKGLLGQ